MTWSLSKGGYTHSDTGVCEKETPPDKHTLVMISLRNTKSGAGEGLSSASFIMGSVFLCNVFDTISCSNCPKIYLTKSNKSFSQGTDGPPSIDCISEG